MVPTDVKEPGIGTRIPNTQQSMLKTGLMRHEALAKVLSQIPRDCFIPMVMVSILARKMGFGTKEVEVEHLRRTGGTQSLHGLLKWARVGSRCVRQLLSIRMSYLGRMPYRG